MDAVSDNVVNVVVEDNDIIRTQESLPRTPNEADLVVTDFKRKLEMKNTVMRRYVDIRKLGLALIALKNTGHPSYQFVVEMHLSEGQNPKKS